MDDRLTISTPEQVAFHYEVAGIGSRFVASLLDHLILGTTIMLVLCGLSFAVPAIGSGAYLSGDGGFTAYLIGAILVLIFFLIFWGYFVVFEMAWNGQTPGKRAGRLRVIRSSGQPIGAGEAMIRNLVRLVDFLPGFYGIGLIAMFVDENARRLGDFAAGTIVVREGHETALRDVRVSSPSHDAAAPPPYTRPDAYSPHYDPALPQTAAPRHDPLPGISLRAVTPTDYRLIRELVARVGRGELPPDRGYELSLRMAHGVAARMSQDFSRWQASGWEPIVFLESILVAKDARGE